MKKIFMLTAAIVLVLMGVNLVHADDYYTCDVLYVGPQSTAVKVRLNCGETATTYSCGTDPTVANRILAVVLTAVSLEKKVYIGVTEAAPTVIKTCWLKLTE